MQNNPETKICQSCGGVLVAASEQFYCPSCVLKNVMQPTNSELAAPSLDLTQSMIIGAGALVKVASPMLESGTRFGDYRILRTLGRGGMGVVYDVEHVPTTRRMALKVMAHSLEDRQSRGRFLREGRLAASINHPNSVYVYATEEIDGHPTISMELVDGATLQQKVKANGPMPVKAAIDAIMQVIDGLEAAYQVGVLHRDVKPNNCFVDSDGKVKIGDFGLSITTAGGDGSAFGQKTQTEITQVGSFLGTPAYSSPEQLRGEPLDHRSDIYAVGMTLYFLLTGEVPFAAENMIQLLARVLDNAAPSVRLRRSDTPVDLDNVIAKCLKKSPGDRFANYTDLQNALLPHSSRVPTPASLGIRFIAGAIDGAVVLALILPMTMWIFQSEKIQPGEPLVRLSSVLLSTATWVAIGFYYAIGEWRFGRTIGKWALGLQVIQVDSKPKLEAALLRSAIYVGVPQLPGAILDLFHLQSGATYATGWSLLPMLIAGWSAYVIKACLFATARASNGNAAIYELLTNTRVIHADSIKAIRTVPSTGESFESTAGTEVLGPYHLLQEVGATTRGRLFLGYDAKPLRRVWIHRAHTGASSDTGPIVNEADRNLNRATRLRWLGGSKNELESWDGFEWLSGSSLRDAIVSQLDWPSAAALLPPLANELEAAAKESSLPDDLSIQNVWVTDSGQLKILPFVAPHASVSGSTAPARTPTRLVEPASTSQRSADPSPKGLELLRHVAKLFIEQFTPTQLGNRAMSLSDRDDLSGMQQSISMAEAQRAIRRIISRRPLRLKYRIAMMVAATLVLPMLSSFSLLTMSILLSKQTSTMPEIAELTEAMRLRRVVGSAGFGSSSEKMHVVDCYIRGNFRKLYADTSRMKSLYGQTQLGIYEMSGEFTEVFAKTDPIPLEVDQVKTEYLQIRDQEQKSLARLEVNFLQQHLVIFWATFGWLEFIWFPSLFTALFFRGGLLLRAFGLTLVNRKAQPASRVRAFIRMLATCIFPSLIILLGVCVNSILRMPGFSDLSVFYAAAIGFVTIVVVAIIIYIGRQRLLSDRLAGTFIVGR